MIVKKLNEEEEFKPIIKKSTTPHPKNSTDDLTTNSNTTRATTAVGQKTLKSTAKLNPIVLSDSKPKLAVEIVGTNTVGHAFQQHIMAQNKKESLTNSKTDWSLDSTLITARSNKTNNNNNNNASNVTNNVPSHNKPVKGVVNNLTEKNYLQLIDNLTNRYTLTLEKKSKSNETDAFLSLNKKVKVPDNNTKLKNLKDKRVKKEFINDLGLNMTTEYEKAKRKGTCATNIFSSNSSNSLNLKNINTTTTNNNNNTKSVVPLIETNNLNTNTSTTNQIIIRPDSPRSSSTYSNPIKPSIQNIKNFSKTPTSEQKLHNILRTSLSRKRISSKMNKISSSSNNDINTNGANAAYLNIVQPISPKKISNDLFSSCKEIIFDINKSEASNITGIFPLSPSASLLTH